MATVTGTNALAVANAAYPASNPSNYVDRAGATNGMQVAGAYLTAEADTLATVAARGGTTTAPITIGNRGSGTTGDRSFVSGASCVSSGSSSHSQGEMAEASGDYSHAEGAASSASGVYAHSEGTASISSGYASHSEGANTRASGYASHSDGFNSSSSNFTSFAWHGSAGAFEEIPYGSHGNGTYNINPVGGLAGFYVVNTPLSETLALKQDSESVYTGAVCPASSGTQYYWTTGTNVTLSVGTLTAGKPVNIAKLNNTSTNSITAIGKAGWVWTGGEMTNTITAGKSMTFGFLIDPSNGETNAYATGVSSN